MKNAKEQKPLISVGLMSGLNYGSEGCREGLWRLAAETFSTEGVNFVILVGGLVDSRSLLEQLKEAHVGVKHADREDVTVDFIRRHAKYLAEKLPRLWGKKTYIMTSPAYDGWIGERIARGVVEVRKTTFCITFIPQALPAGCRPFRARTREQSLESSSWRLHTQKSGLDAWRLLQHAGYACPERREAAWYTRYGRYEHCRMFRLGDSQSR